MPTKTYPLGPFHDAISDPITAEKIKQQQINKLFEYDKFAGKSIFKAKVLSGCDSGHQEEDTSNPNNLYFPSVLRVIDVTDSCTMDPDEASDPLTKKMLVSNHPIAWSDRPYNKKLGFVPRSGQIVDCYYNDPINKRGLTYIYPQEDLLPIAGCASEMGSARDAFQGTTPTINIQGAKAPVPQHAEPPQDLIEKVYKAFGKNLGTVSNHTAKILSIRYPVGPDNSNSFRDMMFIVAREENKWVYHRFSITTSPGDYYLKEVTYRPEGTANMTSPQLATSAYKKGKHRSSYDALVHRGSLYLWLDKNHDGLPSNSKSTGVRVIKSSTSGLNIHRASASGTTGKISAEYRSSNKPSTAYASDGSSVTVNAYTYSAGCQVFANAEDFNSMMSIINRDVQTNGTTSWDYAIIDKSHYDGFVAGKDMSSILSAAIAAYTS